MLRSRGFTLLEVVIAMAIVIMAVMSLVELVGNYTLNTAHLQDKLVGEWVARNRINQIKLDSAYPDTGLDEGEETMGARQWVWKQSIEPAGAEGFRKIEVSVYPKGQNYSVASLIYYASNAFELCKYQTESQLSCKKQVKPTPPKAPAPAPAQAPAKPQKDSAQNVSRSVSTSKDTILRLSH